jgi:type I restriction enzyme M protein
MNMYLHGYDSAIIRWGDTLRNPKHKEGDALMLFDTVVANPPFSLDKWGADDLASDQYNRFWRGLPPKSKGDWAFISHMLESLNNTGKAGVVVPHGVLFRGAAEGKIRTQTLQEDIIEAVIGLPSNLFFGTSIPAAIVIFNKQKVNKEKVLFIDASKGFVPGKNQNVLGEKHIQRITDIFTQFHDQKIEIGIVEERFAYIASLTEIQENDFNLNIPRYVDTFEAEEEIDLHAVMQEIKSLEAKRAELDKEIEVYFKELGLNF